MVKFFNILIPGCIIFMLLFLSSCEKEIEMKISDQPPRLVINSIINPDSLFIVNVSSTWPILESKGNSYLNNACVKVYNQDIFLEQLPLFDMAYYISKSLKPQTGIDYKIEVTCDGYNKATAHLTIPPPVKITNINIVKSISSQYDAEMEFTDPGNEKNYYMISILQGKPDSIGEQVVLQDASKIDFNYNSSIVEIFNQGSSYIDVEQMNDLGLGGITNNIETATEVLFSDEKIQGKTFNFKFDFQYGFTNSKQDSVNLRICLYSLSKDYYYYIKSIALANNFSNDIPLSEKVQLFSNIENGVGIFAGYSSDSKSFTLLNQNKK